MEPTAASAVYLDVVFDDGLLFFDLVNTGVDPVTTVRVRFSDAVTGAHCRTSQGSACSGAPSPWRATYRGGWCTTGWS